MISSSISNNRASAYRPPSTQETQELRPQTTPESSPLSSSKTQTGCNKGSRDTFDTQQSSSGQNTQGMSGAQGVKESTQQLLETLQDLVQELGEALQSLQGGGQAQGNQAQGNQAQGNQAQGGGQTQGNQAQGNQGQGGGQAQGNKAQGNQAQGNQAQGGQQNQKVDTKPTGKDQGGQQNQKVDTKPTGKDQGGQQNQKVDTQAMEKNLGGQVQELGDRKPMEDKSKSKVNPLLAPDQKTADAEIQKQYSAWKDKYVTSEGTGGPDQLRVKRPENGNDTVSEGIGYGMMMAAQAGDKKTMDGLWNYAKGHMNQNGVMDWKIDANNKVAPDGKNGATDADQDMAMALVVADKKFGGYKEDATKLIGNIKEHEVEKGTHVLKPGDQWGGSNETNPSYFAPAYYKAFGEFTGDKSWDKVADKSYDILDKATQQPGFKETGLVPDWCNADGKALRDGKYSYDASRTPMRIGTDAAWNGDPRASAFLDKMNSFWKKDGFDNIKAGYDASGKPSDNFQNSTFTSTAAAGAVTETDPAVRGQAWDAAAKSKDGGYFGDSLRVLSLMQIGNWADKP